MSSVEGNAAKKKENESAHGGVDKRTFRDKNSSPLHFLQLEAIELLSG